MGSAFWNKPMVKFRIKIKVVMFFTLWESRAYRISGTCPPLEGCQGFAVVHYSFTLGRLPHSGISHLICIMWGSIGSASFSTFATLGYSQSIRYLSRIINWNSLISFRSSRMNVWTRLSSISPYKCTSRFRSFAMWRRRIPSWSEIKPSSWRTLKESA